MSDFPILRAFAWDWHAMDRLMKMRLRAMGDVELERLTTECNAVNQTSCWYAEYHASKLVRDALFAEKYRRSKEREDA